MHHSRFENGTSARARNLFGPIVVLLLLAANAALACSDVMLWKPDYPKDDQTAVSVRSLDFGINLSYFLEVVPKGVTRTSTKPPDDANGQKKPKTWTNEHGFVGVSGLWGMNAGEERYFEGMNSEGLSAALLWLEATNARMGTPVRGDTNLSIQHLVAYVLGKATTADAAMDLIDPQKPGFVTVWHEPLDVRKLISVVPRDFAEVDLNLYLVVHDRDRNTAIAQWVDGKLKITRQKDTAIYRVTTNDPPFAKQTDNLDLFWGLRPWNGMKEPADNTLKKGNLWLPGDSWSSSRFVRAYKLNRHAGLSYKPLILWPETPASWSVQIAARIMGRLEEVYGEHSEGATVFHTIFSVVRDHTNRTLYFRGVYNASLRKIDLRKLDFSAGGRWPWIYVDPDPVSPGYPLDFAQDVTGMLRGAESTITGDILEARGLTLSYTLTPDPADDGKMPGQMFLFYRTPAGVTRSWNGTAWVDPLDPVNQVLVPAYTTGQGETLARRRFANLFVDVPVSDWEGTQVFAGYGRSQTEMLMSRRYSMVFSVVDPFKLIPTTVPDSGPTPGRPQGSEADEAAREE